MGLRLTEIILIQVVFYSLVYLWSNYIGFLLCLIITCIASAILILSLIFDFIEKSKVPSSYYWFILSTAIVPAVVMGMFSIFSTGAFDWIDQ